MVARNVSVTAGSLFAGIGGFCLGAKSAGIKVLWANENDAFSCKTYRQNISDVDLVEKDIRDLSVGTDYLKPIDILTAGFPCQPFSQAGPKTGFDDDRGKLFFEIIRLIREFGDAKPKILLMENVPYLQHGNGGEWFSKIMTEIQLAGYWFGRGNCGVLNTAEVSRIPQNRSRLFMVAFSFSHFKANTFRFPVDTKKKTCDSLSKYINRSKKAQDSDYLPRDNRYYHHIKEKIDCGKAGSIYHLRRFGCHIREVKKLCPTLTANMGGGGHNVPFIKDRWGIRKLTVKECALLQGLSECQFPDDVPTAQRYKQIGNAVSVPVVKILADECVQAIVRCK